MATELIVRHICDLCKAAEVGEETSIKTLPLNLFGAEREIDLCESCVEQITEAVSELLVVGRVAKATRQRKQRSKAIAAADDGWYYCPWCPEYAVQTSGGMRYHLEKHHPDKNAHASTRASA